MIIKKTPEQINADYGDLIFNETIIQKRFMHAEEKRMAKLEELKNLRRIIIADEENGTWNANKVLCLIYI